MVLQIDECELDELRKAFRNARAFSKDSQFKQTTSWNTLVASNPRLAEKSKDWWFAKTSNSNLRRRDRLPSSRTPELKDDIARIAKSYERMFDVESTAIDLVAALRPWGAISPDRVTWYFVNKPFSYVRYLGQPYDFAIDTLWESLENDGIYRKDDDPHPRISGKDVPRILSKTLLADAGWNLAVEKNVVISGPTYAISTDKWQPFSFLVNPFRNLIELWNKGGFVFDIPMDGNTELNIYICR